MIFGQLMHFIIATLLKRDSNTDVFLWILKNFQKTYFEEHLRMAAFAETLGSLIRTLFLESPFQNHPDLVILYKYQSLSNQSPL